MSTLRAYKTLRRIHILPQTCYKGSHLLCTMTQAVPSRILQHTILQHNNINIVRSKLTGPKNTKLIITTGFELTFNIVLYISKMVNLNLIIIIV